MSDRHVTRDGIGVRIIGNNLLVRPDPEPETSRGGILLLKGAVLYHTGEVLAVGYLTGKRAAEKTPIPGLQVGDRVLYLRLLENTDANPRLKRTVGDDLIRIRPSDVLLIMSREDLPRVR